MKKIFSFFLLFFFLFSSLNTWANDGNYSDNKIPYNFKNFFPHNNVILKKQTLGGTYEMIDDGSSGDNSKLYQTLVFHAGSLTPGYAPQSYTIMPEDIDGLFGDITINIRNLEYDEKWKNKLRPVITIEYRDVNNSPIYTSYQYENASGDKVWFNPWDYSIYGMGDGNFVSSPTPGKWYGSNKDWNMDIVLPMQKLSMRTTADIYTAGNRTVVDQETGKKIKQAKLKYIKVTFSLASLKQPNGLSYLSCGQYRKSNLEGKDIGNSFGGIPSKEPLSSYNNSYFNTIKKAVEDMSNLYYMNGLKYRMISPITLGLIGSGGGVNLPPYSVNNRLAFQKKIKPLEDESHKIRELAKDFYLDNSKNENDYFTIQDENGVLNRDGSNGTLGIEATPYIYNTVQANKDDIPFFDDGNGTDVFYEDIMAKTLFDSKGDFLLDDCVALRIKPSSNKNTDRAHIQSSQGNFERVPYFAGLGFSFTPFGTEKDFSNYDSSFKYNIGLTSKTPSGASQEKTDQLNPPMLIGSLPGYDFISERPVYSKESYSAKLKIGTSQDKKIKSMITRYCSYLKNEGKISDIEPCKKAHGYYRESDVDEDYKDKNNVKMFNPMLNRFNPLYYDKYGKQKGSLNANYDQRNEFYKAMMKVKGEKDTNGNPTGIGYYAYTENFLSVIPETLNYIWSFDNTFKGDMDSSWQWQTFMPKEKNLDRLKKMEYGATLMKGNRYLYLGTYDLDYSKNGGSPSLNTTVDIRLQRINSQLNPSDEGYLEDGPIAINIDGIFDNGALISTGSKIGDSRDYDPSSKLFISNNDSTAGLPGGIKNITDPELGVSYNTYNIAGPEGNDQTTVYKFDLKGLYDKLKNEWKNDADKLKFLDEWKFNDEGGLDGNVYLRMIVRYPNSDGKLISSAETNIIYVLSNLASGFAQPLLSDGDKIDANIKLIQTTKKINSIITGFDNPDAKLGNEILESRTGSTITDKNKIGFGFRIQRNNLFTSNIINPYLLRNAFPTDDFNLENIGFTSTEKSNFVDKVVKIEDNETVISDDTLSVDGINYKKTCIQPVDYSFGATVYLKKKDGGDVSRSVPMQYVCYYLKDGGTITKNDLENDRNKRILSNKSPDLLPYVDVYLNYQVKQDSDRKEINTTQYPFNLLNGSTGLINVIEKDSNGNILKDVDDVDGDGDTSENKLDIVSGDFNSLVSSGTIDSTSVTNNSYALKDETAISKMRIVDYGEDGYTKDKRISLPLFLYFDKTNFDGVITTFDDLKEENKYNNTSIVVNGYIDAGEQSNGSLKLTWDYPKIESENDNALLGNGNDYIKTTTGNSKQVGDIVKVYPKIINEGDRDVCELKYSYKDITGISNVLTPNEGNIDDIDRYFVRNGDPLKGSGATSSGETVWIDGDKTFDLDSGNDFVYNYKLDNVINRYIYKVDYKFCGEETKPYKTLESPILSFKVDGLPSPGAGICTLNDSEPITGSDVYRSDLIKYKIKCTNITSEDIYDLQIRLPLPDGTNYSNGLKDDWVRLGSLAKGETVDYNTNPLDLIKNVKVSDDAYSDSLIIGELEYKYKANENDSTYLTNWDQINHTVKATTNDMTIIKTLRGPCNGRNEYDYNSNQALQQYPYKTKPGMCVSKINSTDKNGNVLNSNDNKACLVVKYYRLGKDTLINSGPKNNPDPQLYYGRRTDNNTGLENYSDGGRICSIGGSTLKNSLGGQEGSMRSKYSNVRVSMDVSLPDGFELDSSASAYTDYNATVNSLGVSTVGTKKYRYIATLNSSGDSESVVKNNNFQKVLRDGSSDNRNINQLTASLVEIRIPIKAVSKGSGQSGSNTNYNGEVVTDNMNVRVDNGLITYDRKRWEKYDSASRCIFYSCGSEENPKTCPEIKNDGRAVERSASPTLNRTFNGAYSDQEPICISSPGAWIQVLNGGMYVKDLSQLKDIEHQVDPNVPGSYNTNWFYNQGSTSIKPTSFNGADGGANDIYGYDNKFVTKMCYPYSEEKGNYDYTRPYYPTLDNGKCNDGKRPWFYAIVNGDYGYLYNFTDPQLKDILSGTLDLDKGSDSYVIKDRIWIYEQQKYSDKALVLGKQGVSDVKIKGFGSIFVTNDVTNLQDKTATVYINSNVTYSDNTIKTGLKYGEYEGNALAFIINGDLKIGSKVEKMEGMYFVDGDVYIEDGKNTLEIDKLYITGNLYIKRTSTTNSQIDRFTQSQDRPVFRVTGGKGRYYFLTPKIMLNNNTYYNEVEVPANDLNIDCAKFGRCE